MMELIIQMAEDGVPVETISRLSGLTPDVIKILLNGIDENATETH